MKWPIQKIDEEDNDYNLPDSDNYEELDLEDEENEVDCEMCNSTGEGHASGQRCSYCKGSGVIRRKI